MIGNNLEAVVSSYTVNQFLQTVIDTEILHIPVNGLLTTTLLLPIIPELFYNYGNKNLSLSIKPLSGTQVTWRDQKSQSDIHAKALATWMVDEGNNKTVVAFESVLDLDILMALSVNQTNRKIIANVDGLQLTGFNVTTDNLGGSIKKNEENIHFRLSGVMVVIQGVINSIISLLPTVLPDFSLIKYTMAFDYQDGGFGIGINVSRK